MSHIETIKTVITDLNAIKAACARLGVEFREGQKKFNWYGRSVGDYATKGPGDVALDGTCDHAIHVPGVNYEIGLVAIKSGKGWRPVFDHWGYGGGTHDGNKLQEKFCATNAAGQSTNQLEHLVDAYSVEVLKGKARAKGYMTQERVVNGKIQLVVTVGN